MEKEKSFYQIEYKYEDKKVYEIIKRILDIIISIIMLIVAIPIILVAMLMVWIEDNGNPIFVQTRFTKNMTPFKMYKIRTMTMHSEDESSLKELNTEKQHTDKILKVGRILRKLSIDELPQLINVIKGDMSLIGPRPPLEREIKFYNKKQKHRLDIKTGLTCIWQCSGRNNIPFDTWVDMDLYYITHRNLIIDMRIIAETVIAVLTCNGSN